MKAIVYTKYGPPEVAKLMEVTNRMMRECHVRFFERLVGEFPACLLTYIARGNTSLLLFLCIRTGS